MLVEKEVIRPGTYWYTDQKTGIPRKFEVTSDMVKYWHEQGNKMLSLGLTVPVPCEHDFQVHTLSSPEALKNNAGWVKEYRMKDNKLFSVLDIQDESVAAKLPTTIRWTSPWFASFTDGQGRPWNNVIAHLALTTRPRVSEQSQFKNVTAALSLAEDDTLDVNTPGKDFWLSRAGLLKKEKEAWEPQYPIAFSLLSGVALSEMEEEEKKEPEKKEPEKKEYASKFADNEDDISMEQLIADLLSALGIKLEMSSGESGFKRALYNAAMTKIVELSKVKPPVPAPGSPPPKPSTKPNPIVQEQHPMYMSLEDISKIPDETMRNIALSMYNENVKLQAALDKTVKETSSLRDAKLAEEQAKRKLRVERLSRMSPRVKADLEAMEALPSMALSMGDNGTIVDPMGSTLSVLEKGLADIPALLKTEQTAFSIVPQPTDAEMSSEQADQLADSLARQMGCVPAS